MTTRVRAGSRDGRAPAVVTGFGLGAFIDGIVLHQVLQWHHLVVGYRAADTRAGLQVNVFWDGIFHVASWTIVLLGVLWMAPRGTAVHELGRRRVSGLLLVGAGTFHVVDQLVFHLALQAHHIRMVPNYQVYDWSFFALGVAMVAAGALLARGGASPAA